MSEVSLVSVDGHSSGLLHGDSCRLTIMFKRTRDRSSEQIELLLQECLEFLFFLVDHVVTKVGYVVIRLIT